MLTDHKPPVGVFGPEKAMPNIASSRMVRWALILQGYLYGLRHKAGSRNQNADALSRIPLGEYQAAKSRVPVPQEPINLIEMLNSGPITATEIGRSTGKDPMLVRVHRYLLTGWPRDTDPGIAKFYSVKEELSLQGECILWGTRVIVPGDQRKAILQELHRYQGHPGMVRMKALARSYVWWPRIDADIESRVKECSQCQQSRPNPPATYLHPWEKPINPWESVHVDYATIEGQYVLIMVDAHS